MGLRYAKSFGHVLLEVEHVALALLQSEKFYDAFVNQQIIRSLEAHLSALPRVFGSFKIDFGPRLDSCLDQVEATIQSGTIDQKTLWQGLHANSTALKNAMLKAKSENEKSQDFETLVGKPVGDKDSKIKANASAAPKKDSSGKQGDTYPKQSRIDAELRKYTVDLTELAERQELDPVIGRDQELVRVIEILGRKRKNNPILLGDPGVGKSAVAEGLAQKIVQGKVPDSMKDKRVLSLDLGSVMAGAKFRGEFEDRLKNIVNALIELKGNIILFIDEIHTLVGTGNNEGSLDAANMLKPALARGELQCLAATTMTEYRKYIEKDAALARRFQPIIVDEPSVEASLGILRGLKTKYELHHGIKISEAALEASVRYSKRYIPDRNLPDKAIDLMDEALSRKKIQIESMPRVMGELKSRLEELEIEKSSLQNAKGSAKAIGTIEKELGTVRSSYDKISGVWKDYQTKNDHLTQLNKSLEELKGLFEEAKTQADFVFAARLTNSEIPRLESQIGEAVKYLANLQSQHSFLVQSVEIFDIAEVVAQWTGIPVQKIVSREAQKARNIEAALEEKVFGQSEAVHAVSRSVKRMQAGINDPSKPVGVFLFLGTTGVGKTELAKALAEQLFDDETKIVRIDMSEYMEAHSVSRLIGAPPGYVGFDAGGELTDAVRTRPYCIVLFDEIEKAHPKVLDIFLQIFDEGRLTDGRGRVANFANTIIILTSNLPVPRFPAHSELARKEMVRDALKPHLRSELINRIDEVVVFNRLQASDFQKLVIKLLKDLNKRLADQEIRIELGANLLGRLTKLGQDSEFGGRAVKRAFQTLVVDTVSEQLLASNGPKKGLWSLDIDAKDKFVWDFNPKSKYVLPPAR